jgi:hypothetical protein
MGRETQTAHLEWAAILLCIFSDIESVSVDD